MPSAPRTSRSNKHISLRIMALAGIIFCVMGCFWLTPDYQVEEGYDDEFEEAHAEIPLSEYDYEDTHEGWAPSDHEVNEAYIEEIETFVFPDFSIPIQITPRPTPDYDTVFAVEDVSGEWMGFAVFPDESYVMYQLTLIQSDTTVEGTANPRSIDVRDALLKVQGTYVEGILQLKESDVQEKDSWEKDCYWFLDLHVIKAAPGPMIVGTFQEIESETAICDATGTVDLYPTFVP